MKLFILFLCLVIANAEVLNIVGSYYFGCSEASLGNIVVIGAQGTLGTGSVYIYSCNDNQCILVGQPYPSDLHNGDSYGRAVAISGTRIAIGAYLQNSQIGAVYLYDCAILSNCTFIQKISGSVTPSPHFFGYAIAFQDGYLVVGAPASSSFLGKVFVFDCSGSNCTTSTFSTLIASEQATNDYFGDAVAIYDGRVVVGARFLNNTGAAFTYYCITPLSCVEKGRLEAPGNTNNSLFGQSVSIFGEFIAVGAPFFNNGIGRVYIYSCVVNPNCSLIFIINPPSSVNGSFGISVAMYDTGLIVGSNLGNGSAYLYDCSELPAEPCVLVETLSSTSSRSGIDNFGSQVTISSDVIVIGAPYSHYTSSAFSFPNILSPTPSSANGIYSSGLFIVSFFFVSFLL
jgi:hypothetical protein